MVIELKTAAIPVLVIDDEPSFRELVTDYLTHEGPRQGVAFTVQSVRDGTQAETLIEGGFEPRVLILDNDFADIGQSENEGLEAILPRTHVWKAQTGRLEDLKVIIVSGRLAGRDIDDLKRGAMAWGAAAFLEKAGLIEEDRLIPDIIRLLDLNP